MLTWILETHIQALSQTTSCLPDKQEGTANYPHVLEHSKNGRQENLSVSRNYLFYTSNTIAKSHLAYENWMLQIKALCLSWAQKQQQNTGSENCEADQKKCCFFCLSNYTVSGPWDFPFSKSFLATLSCNFFLSFWSSPWKLYLTPPCWVLISASCCANHIFRNYQLLPHTLKGEVICTQILPVHVNASDTSLCRHRLWLNSVSKRCVKYTSSGQRFTVLSNGPKMKHFQPLHLLNQLKRT